MVYRCAMVLLSVFGFNVQKHRRRSPTPKDVIDIGIEIATGENMRIDHQRSKNRNTNHQRHSHVCYHSSVVTDLLGTGFSWASKLDWQLDS